MKEYIITFECPVTESSARIAYQVQQKLVGELIRCKDCKHNHDGICGWHYGVSPVDGYRWIVDDDDFCSCGERKDAYVTLYHDDIHFVDEDAERAFYESLTEREEE